jgi:uncharacterized protein (TIGR03437 family)
MFRTGIRAWASGNNVRHLITVTRRFGIAILGIFAACVPAFAQGASSVSCTQQAAAHQIRYSGYKELLPDLLISCTGGTPTGSGQTVPFQTLTVTVNTDVSSRTLLAPWSEVLLLVDDPAPANQLVCPLPACAILGTNGGNTYSGAPGRPNVFVGQYASVNAISFYFPFDPPGAGTRKLRIVNLRVAGVYVGVGGTVTANTAGVPLTNPSIAMATAQNAFSLNVADPQFDGANIASFKLRLTEVFSKSFKARTFAGPGAVNQDLPGSPRDYDTGFYNSAFPSTQLGDLSQAGLADTGTRVLVHLMGVPSMGVTFTVPATINLGLFVGQARLINSDSYGGGPYSPASGGQIQPGENGEAFIVYEFTEALPGSFETLEIPFTVNYAQGARALTHLDGEASLAPSATYYDTSIPSFEPQFGIGFSVDPPPLSFLTSALPNGRVGTVYSQMIQATGGTPPYTFQVSSGVLPPGLALQPDGTLSGTPVQEGTFTFIVGLSDNQEGFDTRTFQILIAPSVEIITSSPLPPGTAGSPYATTFAAAGGKAPYRFFFVDNPPIGFSLSQNGVLSGMPPAPGTFTFAIQVLDALNSSNVKSFTLNIAPAGSIFQLSTLQLTFTGAQGGPPPPVQSLTIQSLVQQPVAFTVTTDGGSPSIPAPGWLSLLFANTSVPNRITVGANQGNMQPGTYAARILLGVAGNTGQPLLIVTVSLTVTAPVPKLSVFPDLLRFTRQVNLPGLSSKTVQLSNTGGGGPIAFTASVVNASRWIKSVTPNSGQAGSSTPTFVRVEIDSTGLPVGFQRDIVRFTWAGGQLDLPVVLYVAPAGAIMQLTQTGVYFRSSAGNYPRVVRRVWILNQDAFSTISWTATVVRGDEWLAVAPPSGNSRLSDPGWITLSVKPAAAALPPGPKYALVRIDAPNTANAPQYVIGVLDIRPDATTGLDFDHAGAVLTAFTGSAQPVAAVINVSTGGNSPVPFTTSILGSGAGNIFSVSPASGDVSPATPTPLAVTANPTGLVQGVYPAEIAVAAAGRVETLAVTLIVADAPAGESLPAGARAAPCVPTSLSATQIGLTNNFSVPAGWPTALVVDLRDNCGTQVQNGTVVASFSNGDPPLPLTGDGVTGLYSATWQPVAQVTPMTITIHAQSPTLPLITVPLTGGITPNTVPTLFQNGAVHNLDPKLGGPLAPGLVAAVYGSNMASVSESTGAVPLVKLYKGTQVLVGPYEAPLYYVSPGQLNIQIPSELAPNQPYPIVVSANGALTVPDTVNLVPVVPGVAYYSSNNRAIAQHANFDLVTDANPAKRDEFLIIYLIGLGATNPAVASGDPSPGTPPFGIPVTPVTVTLGGIPVEVPFVGLTPFSVGLYQINMKVPVSAPLNTPLDLVITQGGVSANVAQLIIAP